MTNPQTLGDEELLRLTRAGDEHAFTVLYRRHQGPVYRFALQVSGSESVAEDVTQEVFLALMGEFSRFDSSRGSLAPYLYGVARNQVRRHLERGKFHVPLDEDSDEASFEPATAAGDPLGDLTLREGLSALRQAILTLPLTRSCIRRRRRSSRSTPRAPRSRMMTGFAGTWPTAWRPSASEATQEIISAPTELRRSTNHP